MLIDAAKDPGLPQHLDFCVIGTGPAGLAVAFELETAGFDVGLVEAGDLNPSRSSQFFYQGIDGGITYALDGSRIRALGGSSNCWGGWCRQLEPIEFEKREWMPASSWPIQHRSIAKYYGTAGKILNVDGKNFNPDFLKEKASRQGIYLTKESRIFSPRIWQVSVNRRLAEVYRDRLASSQKIFLIYNCTITDILFNGLKVSALKYVTAIGKHGELSSRNSFVLALGGIETSRLLLIARSRGPSALQSISPWLGKGFMEHPARINGWRMYVPYRSVPFVEEDGGALQPIPGQDFRIAFGFGASEAAQRKYRLPGFWAVPGAAQKITDEKEEAAARLFVQNMQRLDKKPEVRSVDVTWAIEQSVNVKSQIRLSHTDDSMGQPKVLLDWEISDSDARTVKAYEHLIAKDFLDRKIARFRILNSINTSDKVIDYGNHHMGATRMAASPKDGVVNFDCKVFGTSNLYLAGSGVFPTSAVTNPTMALTALALRLGDHLKRSV
ncbi:FAD-dependent oxidoreductase [Variovorax sp. J22R133]|uniref:FAD-dependent oxidoreductase n=1 Tax=Variovorax brevis TaxID=3053503 RepID=UPI002577344E|nr:FAD-dependent oxidoreductase [Variovorax sp. J22R133]MDM0114696.1 FAD-dependent oxidoreductase [Variovorax sp. J22R133]